MQQIIRSRFKRYYILKDNDDVYIIDALSNKLALLFPGLNLLMSRNAWLISDTEKIEIIEIKEENKKSDWVYIGLGSVVYGIYRVINRLFAVSMSNYTIVSLLAILLVVVIVVSIIMASNEKKELSKVLRIGNYKVFLIKREVSIKNISSWILLVSTMATFVATYFLIFVCIEECLVNTSYLEFASFVIACIVAVIITESFGLAGKFKLVVRNFYKE